MAEKKRILIVEDDAIIAADISAALTSFGYEILGPMDTGEAVVEAAPQLKADLILMDINLKGELDGITTAERIQTIIPAPLIFLSALSDEDTLRRAKLVNPYGYLLKPFDAAELRTNIEITLGRHAAESRPGQKPGAAATGLETEEWGDLSESSSIEERAEFLSKLPLFQDIEAAVIRDIAERSVVTLPQAGQFILSEGEDAEGGFIPISGRISVTKTSESGKELIVALLAPGDCFGLFGLVEGFRSAVSARTQVDSKVLWIPKKTWEYLTEHSPAIFPNLTQALATRLGSAYVLASSLAHAKVEDRIIHTLLALMPEFGKSSKKGSQEARIFMTRKELAELTGTTPETAIRVTKSLERDGILDLTRPGIIKVPSLDGLRNYLNHHKSGRNAL